MIRLLFLAATFGTMLFAGSYNTFLLETQLTLLPKISILEKSKTAVGDNIELIIVHGSGDDDTAEYAAQFLENKFGGRLGKYNLKVTITTFDKCCPPVRPSLIYCLNGTHEQLSKVQSFIRATNTVSAVYDSENLKNGFLFSVTLERHPVVLMNKKVLKDRGLEFPQTLYAIVKAI